MLQFKQLSDEQQFKSVLFVPYEDLVVDPEQVLRQVQQHLHLPARTKYNIFDSPAKYHGHSNGREKAVQKLKSREYLEKYGPNDLSLLCNGLDQSAIEGLLSEQGPYTQDC